MHRRISRQRFQNLLLSTFIHRGQVLELHRLNQGMRRGIPGCTGQQTLTIAPAGFLRDICALEQSMRQAGSSYGHALQLLHGRGKQSLCLGILPLLQERKRMVHICLQAPLHQIVLRAFACHVSRSAGIIGQVVFRPESSTPETPLLRHDALKLRADIGEVALGLQQHQPLGLPGEPMLQQQLVSIVPVI